MGRGPPAGLQDVVPGGEGGGKNEQAESQLGGVGDQGGRQKPEREGQRLRKKGNRDLEEERTARHSREMIVK